MSRAELSRETFYFSFWGAWNGARPKLKVYLRWAVIGPRYGSSSNDSAGRDWNSKSSETSSTSKIPLAPSSSCVVTEGRGGILIAFFTTKLNVSSSLQLRRTKVRGRGEGGRRRMKRMKINSVSCYQSIGWWSKVDAYLKCRIHACDSAGCRTRW